MESRRVAPAKTPTTGAGGLPYLHLYRASSEDRIDMIRAGMRAVDAKQIVADLNVNQKSFFRALNLKTATINRKVAGNDLLSSSESERLLGIARLIGQLEAIVEESGDPEGFDAPEWLSRWLREPLPVLGGVTPFYLLDTMEGQAMVSGALAQIQSGAYA